MKAYHLLLIPALFAILTSCEQTINLDLPEYEEKLVVECLIESDDFANAEIILSSSEEKLGYVNDLDTFEPITDAVVELTTALGKQICSYDYSEDDRSIYRCEEALATTGEMSLRIEHEGNVATAETSVPQPVSIIEAEIDIQLVENDFYYYNSSFYRYFLELKFKDVPSEENFYLVGYSISDQPNSPNLERPENTAGIFYTDIERDGQEIRVRERIDFYFGYGSNVEELYISAFVYSLSKSAHDYLSSREVQDNQFEGPFTEPTPIHGNINNGLGVFGVSVPSPPYQITFTP